MTALLRRPRLVAALVALIASISGILNDFVYDDRAMFLDVSRLHGFDYWREILSQPFWPPPFYDRLYRPLTSLVLATEYAIGGGTPFAFRVVSIGLYVLTAVLFHSLARRLVSPRAALAATALWAVHPVHVEAIAQAVNQSELILGAGAMLMVITYLDARRSGVPAPGTWAWLTLLFALMTLVKESAFILPALLVVTDALLIPGETWRTRIRRLWPGYAALGVVAALSLALRGIVLSGAVLVANPASALRGVDLGGRMFAMLQVVPMWLRLFVWPLHLQVDFDSTELGMPAHFGFPETFGLLLLVAAFTVFVTTRKRLVAASFGLAWCAIGLLPVSNIIPVYFLLAERTLFLPSIGFFLAVAGIGQWSVARWPSRRPMIAWACGLLCLLGLIRSTVRELSWNSRHIRVERQADAGSSHIAGLP